MDLLLKPVPHDQASAFIANKPVLAREAFDNLLPDLKARAFTITGIEAANVMQNVRDRIAELPQGADWDKVKADIADKISPWLDTGAEESGGQPSSMSASERRAELLLRQHGFQAYAAANEEVMQRQKDAFPFAQYLGAEDERERPSHFALNNIILPVDDPFWETHTGPWDWGCRCQKVPLQSDDVAAIQAEDANKKPEEQRVIDGPRLQALRENRLITAGPGGMPQFVNVAPSANYTFNPKTLVMDVKALEQRYDPETWDTFTKWAKIQQTERGVSVWQWLMQRAPAGVRRTATTPPTPAPTPTPAPRPVARRVPPPESGAGIPVRQAQGPEPVVGLPVTPITPVRPVIPAPTRTAPVSAAIEIRTTGAHKPQIENALAAIDRVHDDGDLPPLPVIGQSGNALGIYQFNRQGGAVQIGIGNYPQKWPGLTTAHEIGHFLDHQVLGARGSFASVDDPALAAFRSAVLASRSVLELQRLGIGLRSDFLEPYELWARAYAQYIAKKSGDPLLLAQLDKIRTGDQSWRQWSDDDFAPIEAAIDDLFRAKGWLK